VAANYDLEGQKAMELSNAGVLPDAAGHRWEMFMSI